jgi:hypothetical protein
MNPHGAPQRSLSNCPTLTGKKETNDQKKKKKRPGLESTKVIVHHVQNLMFTGRKKSSRIEGGKLEEWHVYLVTVMDPTSKTVRIDPVSPSKI